MMTPFILIITLFWIHNFHGKVHSSITKHKQKFFEMKNMNLKFLKCTNEIRGSAMSSCTLSSKCLGVRKTGEESCVCECHPLQINENITKPAEGPVPWPERSIFASKQITLVPGRSLQQKIKLK